MFQEVKALQSPTGATLAWRSEPAVGPEMSILQISHGLAEHSARYGRFAHFMSQRGFHVYAHDHRGHGVTQSSDAPFGRYAGSGGPEKVVEDVRAVTEMAKALHPGLPVILFGHSMGGLIALNAAETHPTLYDGLAVWNSNFNPGLAGRAGQFILKVERMLKGSDVPSAILPPLTFSTWAKAIPNHKTQSDWLSRDDREVAAYIADPLCGFDTSVSLWIDLFALTYGGASSERLRRLPSALPIHLVGGGQDPATNGARETSWFAQRMKRYGLTNVTTRIYPEMRHETLNEIGREVPMRDFANWSTAVVDTRRKA
ncbi:alpha-beta hydrolase superfamily lysophospholipase [Pararhizobium capsulatum DSM 1112]|uniref:Alpha-beta hydrolase superfamily lysophospholipase n=1 Tax=Pararhizobium capsulatum DSM 1112 TaxID=1121113 RepID=A0ABU0BRU1_9HYPH|nr:alpha/beta hydrolase [Pararhizobium capsulatum]MDQ0320971.1 alpha-beta hydrolase superfamily lysophospholipase [Pararhizobium capsulatum DSM 1112]